MSYEKVAQAKGRLIIGLKQATKVMKARQASQVIVAADIDHDLKEKILNLAIQMDTPYEVVASKEQLGKACGIEVGTAVVAISGEVLVD